MIGQNTHSRNIFSVHGFLNLSVTIQVGENEVGLDHGFVKPRMNFV